MSHGKYRGGLCLTRSVGEAILIGDSIRISILRVRRGRVDLRIEAPPDVPIHRTELAQRMTAGVVSLARELRHPDLDGLPAGRSA